MRDREVFTRALEKAGRVIAPPTTSSMWPMLRARRDTAVLVKPDRPLRRLDVALYENAAGGLWLHRIVRVTEDGYDFCGDRQTAVEQHIPPSAIVAVMTGFYRDERYIPADSRIYRAYVRVWSALPVLRRTLVPLDKWIWRRRRGGGHEEA